MDISQLPGWLLLYAVGYVVMLFVSFRLAISQQSSVRRNNGLILNLTLCGLTVGVIDSQQTALNSAFANDNAWTNMIKVAVAIFIVIDVAYVIVSLQEARRQLRSARRL